MRWVYWGLEVVEELFITFNFAFKAFFARGDVVKVEYSLGYSGEMGS